MLLLVSQMEVGSTSTTVGSCTEPKLAGSIAQEPSHVSQQFQLDSRHDYHAILSGSMVPHACNLLTRPGIQLMLLLVEMCLKKQVKRKQAQDPAQSDMFPVPLGQLLVPQPLRWSR